MGCGVLGTKRFFLSVKKKIRLEKNATMKKNVFLFAPSSCCHGADSLCEFGPMLASRNDAEVPMIR